MRMSRQRVRDTDPEVAVRRRLHASGLRYRVQYPVPQMSRRTIDIAFTRVRLAVFIDGCFWHGCWEHPSVPLANREWWLRKIARNQERDAETTAHLRSTRWLVLRYWEHEPPELVADAIGKQFDLLSSQRIEGTDIGGSRIMDSSVVPPL